MSLDLISCWQDNHESQANGHYKKTLENRSSRMKLKLLKAYLLDNEHGPQRCQSNPWATLNGGHK